MEKFPPFYIGQEVEAVTNHSQGTFKKGDKFKITGIIQACCHWNVTIGIRSTNLFNLCKTCNSRQLSRIEWMFDSVCFRAITPEFQSITLEKVLEIETSLISQN